MWVEDPDSPVMPPPPGIKANFDNPPNRNSEARISITVCLIVTTLCVVFRACARWKLDKKISHLEVLMILAYIAYGATLYSSIQFLWTPGYFVHAWNLHNSELIRPTKLVRIQVASYSIVMPLLKTATMLDWCRLFVPGARSKSGFWWICIIVIGMQWLWGIACVIFVNIPCMGIWNCSVKQCYRVSDVLLTSASVQVVTILVMVILPQKKIWSLKLTWQKRLGVSAMFGVGSIALASACLRFFHTAAYSKSYDQIFHLGYVLEWSNVEMTCDFCVFSAAFLPRVIKECSLPLCISRMLGTEVTEISDYSKFADRHSQKYRSQQTTSHGTASEGDEIAMSSSNVHRVESQEYLQLEVAYMGNKWITTTLKR